MRILPDKLRRSAGFTLPELMIASGLTAVVGSAAAYLSMNASILYAKNTADNVAHDQNRIAISRLVRDIHAATSIPQLGHIEQGNQLATAPSGSWMPYGTNVTFVAESGSGPSAGIAFKKMGSASNPNGGPYKVRNDPGNKDMIQIDSGTDNPPHIGTEIIFPYYDMEGTIYKVTSNGNNHYNVWIKGGLETRIKEKGSAHERAANPIVAYYMSRYAYVVEDGELKFYASTPPPAGVTWPITVARNIVEAPQKTPHEVNVRDDRYQPSALTIKRGESVLWKWKNDADDQSVTSQAPHPHSGAFNSGKLDPNDTFTWSFTNAGTFAYKSMKGGFNGSITVKDRDYNAKPFKQTSSQYVTINLTTEDKNYSNRNYRAVNSLIAGSVPIRAQLSKTQ